MSYLSPKFLGNCRVMKRSCPEFISVNEGSVARRNSIFFLDGWSVRARLFNSVMNNQKVTLHNEQSKKNTREIINRKVKRGAFVSMSWSIFFSGL